MLKRHISIGVFVVYIDTGSPVSNIPSKSHDLADENNKILTEWKWFKTTVLSHISAIFIRRTSLQILNLVYIKGSTGIDMLAKILPCHWSLTITPDKLIIIRNWCKLSFTCHEHNTLFTGCTHWGLSLFMTLTAMKPVMKMCLNCENS